MSTGPGSASVSYVDAQVAAAAATASAATTAAATPTSGNGDGWTRGQVSELIVLSNAGLTSDSVANLLPANSVIQAVVSRIIAAITGGTKSVGTITLTGLPVANETFVIGSQTFTWKALRAVAGEVTIGASAAAACTNIIAAVTADITNVVATQGAGTTVVITAAAGGAAGNSIIFTEATSNLTIDGSGTLGGTTSGADTTGYQLGDGTTAARFAGTSSTLTAGATQVGLAHQQGGVSTNGTGPVQTSAAKLRVTAVGGTPQTGSIRVTVFYSTFTAPTA